MAPAEGAVRFFTGFPGFLGSALIERLLARTDDRIVCLVQDRYRDLAEHRASALLAARGDSDDRIELHTGDITEADLGLGADARRRLQSAVTEVYHLAAVYDLGVSRELGTAVNVHGTDHVLDFATGVADLRRLHYVSTCYVSGRYEGVFGADDLAVGQSFNNHYEATKFRAERHVRDRMGPALPTTIYRPAVVVGDSTTGETTKYDGPYYLLSLLRRQRRVAVVPGPLTPEAFEFNVVPRDFVVDAMDRLARRDDTVGGTYQLCDPRPPTVGALIDRFAAAAGRRAITVPIERRLLRTILESIPGLAAASGIEPAAIDYFWHPTIYTNETTRAVLGDAALPPRFETYVETLVEYVREHPDLDDAAMA
jgi:thioester reductase-like protein